MIAVGGNEDKGTYPNPKTKKRYYLNFFELGILKRVVSELGGPDARIEVITTASMIPEEMGQLYENAFGILGCTNVGVMHIRTTEDAYLPDFLDRIKKCKGVMFTGGNQSRLTMVFGGTEFHTILCDRYQNEDFVIAGTSAGAMAMSRVMIKGGSSFEALMKGTVRISKGLGFSTSTIIDSHFVKRGRFGRLMEAIASYPKKIGIGLGEDTGVLITEGNMIETIGSGLVIIVDGHDIGCNNVEEVEKGKPLSIENIRIHVLAKGNIYDIRNRKFHQTESPAEREEIKVEAETE